MTIVWRVSLLPATLSLNNIFVTAIVTWQLSPKWSFETSFTMKKSLIQGLCLVTLVVVVNGQGLSQLIKTLADLPEKGPQYQEMSQKMYDTQEAYNEKKDAKNKEQQREWNEEQEKINQGLDKLNRDYEGRMKKAKDDFDKWKEEEDKRNEDNMTKMKERYDKLSKNTKEFFDKLKPKDKKQQGNQQGNQKTTVPHESKEGKQQTSAPELTSQPSPTNQLDQSKQGQPQEPQK